MPHGDNGQPGPMLDRARWDGVQIRSNCAGIKRRHGGQVYWYDGYRFRTGSEAHLAQLLANGRVPYTAEVKFTLVAPGGGPREFVPDFVFDKQAFVWHGKKGRRPMLVHGIEAKARDRDGKFPERAWENVRLLEEQRGIVILLISNEGVARHWRQGSLPLTRLEP